MSDVNIFNCPCFNCVLNQVCTTDCDEYNEFERKMMREQKVLSFCDFCKRCRPMYKLSNG